MIRKGMDVINLTELQKTAGGGGLYLTRNYCFLTPKSLNVYFFI